jgi:outer membrane receptor protein involved in Fe transport
LNHYHRLIAPFISFSLVLFSPDLPAQTNIPKGSGRISGTVIDSVSRMPVEFATIALTGSSDNRPIDGSVCDANGKFAITRIPTGNYAVVISFIGFETKKITVSLTEKRSEVDLGTIDLSPSVTQLNEVIVEGQKSIVEEKVDRTIYNAENDLTTKGGDATDVLKRVPLLSVDVDGNVSLRGSQSIKVLINNKPSTITSSSVADALKQIPADMIKTVEVITSPSSRYDAEGSAGIINIVLKKNTLEGAFLNVDGSAGSRGSNLSVSSNYRRGKMGFSLGAFSRGTYNVKGAFTNEQTTRYNGDTTLNIQSMRTHNNGFTSQYTFGWDYDINKNNSITTSVRYGEQNQNTYQDNLLTNKYERDTLTSATLQNVKSTNRSGNVDASMMYTKSFSKKNREFNFLGVYSRNEQNSGFVSNSLQPDDFSILGRNKNENKGYTQEITLQGDFQEPISKDQLIEFGAKDIMRTVFSDYKHLVADGSSTDYYPSPYTNLSNGFNYKQSITSGYMAYNLNAFSNYTIKGGARYEYTHIRAHFNGESDIQIPSYGVLVPSVNVSRKLSNGRLLRLSYNKRIQRPNLQNLNPNIQSANSINVTVGNPNLKPEYTDNYEIAYKTFVKNNPLNLSTFIRYNTNDIQQARSIRNDTVFSIFQNIGTEANYGFSAFMTVNVSKNFTLNGGADLFYRVLKNNSNDPYINASNHGFTKNFRLSGNYNLPKSWTIQFFSFFQGRNYNLQGYRTSPINHSISAKKDIFQKKGSIGFGVDTFITPTYHVHSTLESAYISQYTTNTLYNFIARVNFSYKIGKIQEGNRKKSLLDDRDN